MDEWMAMMAMKQDCNLQNSHKYYTMNGAKGIKRIYWFWKEGYFPKNHFQP